MTRLYFALAALFAALSIAGTMDLEDAEIAEAERKDELAAIAAAAEATRDALAGPQFILPLAYKAVVCQSDYGEPPLCLFYKGRK